MRMYLISSLSITLGISCAFTISRTSQLFAAKRFLKQSKNKRIAFDDQRTNNRVGLFTHTKAVSPYLVSKQNTNESHRNDVKLFKETKTSLEDLSSYLKATPSNLLYLSNESSDGERGVFLNQSVGKDDILLNIPLSSCIRDDKPPVWYDTYKTLHKNDDVDDENFHYNPSKWATRLAASLLDLKLRPDTTTENGDISNDEKTVRIGLQKWLSMMPDEKFLSTSLPIHWPEDIIPHAKCTALELSIDASYFARGEALADLREATKFQSEDIEWNKINLDNYDLESMVSNVFDIVQTRSCRAERLDGIQLRPSLRILAPIFDFINHGSYRHDGEGSANAYFGLEGEDDDTLSLVVRARGDIQAHEEILIDYGDSARPAWRCLASYGFVPNYHLTSPDDQLEDGEEDESVAEVFMDGARYEVGSHTIPFEMVEAASISALQETRGSDTNEIQANVLLTPEVALRIAKRVSDAAFQLLIDPSGADENEKDKDELMSISKQLAGSLRWSQHQVLLNCAIGLRDYAGRQ